MEADKITVKRTTGGVVTHIDFRQTYNTPPAVFTLATNQGGNPATLRVVNVTTAGFDIYTIEPQGEDGPHLRMTTVPYIAIEKGEHTLPDGTKILVGSIDTKKYYQKGVSDEWESISISGFNTTPVILAEIQTRNNERTDKSVPDAVSKPWFSAAVKDISSSGFSLTLNKSETTDGTIETTESIAYLAIDSSLQGSDHYFASNEYLKIMYESIRSDEIIKGWDDSSSGYEIDFSQTFDDPIVVANMNSFNEADGGWFRRVEIDDSYIKLVVDEDQANDTERNHIAQRAGVLLFSEPFDATFGLESSAKMIINEVMYKQTQTGDNNDEFIELYVTNGGNIEGYVLSDQDTNYYIFPECSVEKGDYVVVHVGSGTNSCSGSVKHLYQNKSQYLNDSKDDVLLLRPTEDVTTTTQGSGPKTFNATPQDYIAYGSLGSEVDAIPTSIKNNTLSWNYDYGNELDNANTAVSIALTPNANDSNTSACWEFSASGNASDNGCANYIPTRDTESSSSLTYSMGKDNNGLPKMSITKSSIVISDPVNGTSTPKRIPGAIIRYCFRVDNTGDGDAQNVKIDDSLSGDGRESLTYKNSGFIVQNINSSCDCKAITNTSGTISNTDVAIEIGELKGTSDSSKQRACAYIETEMN